MESLLGCIVVTDRRELGKQTEHMTANLVLTRHKTDTAYVLLTAGAQGIMVMPFPSVPRRYRHMESVPTATASRSSVELKETRDTGNPTFTTASTCERFEQFRAGTKGE